MNASNFYFLVLDIETSKRMEFDKNLNREMPVEVWLSYGVCKLYNIKGNEIKCLRFRKWDKLRTFLTNVTIATKKMLYCYVHNLSYEFDFLIKNLSKPKSFICNSTHSVISCKLEDFNIEFRCTYQLSKLSLAKIGDMFNLKKLDSEYRTIYEDDEVTEEEWIYCERDCDIIVPYIQSELKSYSMLSRLPYTSTGKVRAKLRELLKGYDDKEWDLMPDEDCIDALNKSFRGGLTMSNPRFTGKIINRTVRSFDEKSKYPSVMLTEEFPYTIKKSTDFNDKTYKNYKFWIARVKLIDIYSNFEWGVISSNTCEDVDYLYSDIFNGKIINAPFVELYLTSVDLELFKKVYHIKKIEFIEFYHCDKYGRLPEPFIELIKIFAKNKVEIGKKLKQIESEFGEQSLEYIEVYKEYMDAKSMLNGIYGMMVQKLTPQEFYIDEQFMWHEKLNPYVKIENKHLFRNFLFGIFITAYSRFDLVNNIIMNCPLNFVYCDTDSIKFIDVGREFIDYNKDLPDYLRKLPYLKGFNKFEEETPYTKFLTYGAKKYCYIKNDVFGFTVAGLPKNTPIQGFDEFVLGAVFSKCKLAKRYIYHNKMIDVDCYTNDVIGEHIIPETSNGGVALFEVDYKLSMTNRDLFYIKENEKQWQEKNTQQNILI